MLRLKIPSDKAAKLIAERLELSYTMKKDARTGYSYNDVLRWTVTTKKVLEGIFGPYDAHVIQFENIRIPRSAGDVGKDSFTILELFRNLLIAYLEEIKIYSGNPEFCEPVPVVSFPIDNRDLFYEVFDKFHLIATRLKHRSTGKTPFLVTDADDVQDLLRALLTPVFDDIRCEEPAPSTGRSFSKMDFVVNGEKVVIEAKPVSDSDTDEKLVNEVLVDIARYKERKECRVLVCFIYDPNARVKQPDLMKNYLEHQGTDDFGVVVVIKP
jgi:hypothetical protein